MRDLKRYWLDVRTLEKTLPDYVSVMNLEGGDPVEVTAAGAALLLQEKSHRLATEEEIRSHRDAAAALNRESSREDLRRRGIAVVPVHQD